MSVIAFDTLAFSKKLRAQFTAEQAETLAEAFVAGVDEQLATKTDIKDLELRLESRISQVEVKISQVEIRVAESANRIILWTVGSIFSSAALIIAVLKFVG